MMPSDLAEVNPLTVTLVMAGVGWAIIIMVAILLSPLRPRFLSCVKRAWHELRELTWGRDEQGGER